MLSELPRTAARQGEEPLSGDDDGSAAPSDRPAADGSVEAPQDEATKEQREPSSQSSPTTDLISM